MSISQGSFIVLEQPDKCFCSDETLDPKSGNGALIKAFFWNAPRAQQPCRHSQTLVNDYYRLAWLVGDAAACKLCSPQKSISFWVMLSTPSKTCFADTS